MEHRPRALFERLFGAAGTTDPKVRAILRQEDRSILDAVNEDVKRLRGKLGGTDRGKIDQYLEAVRDVERRIQRAEAQDGPRGAAAGRSRRRSVGLLGLLQADGGSDGSRLADRHDARPHVPDRPRDERAAPIPSSDSATPTIPQTHHHGEPDKIAKVIQINTFHTKMLAYYLDKLRTTPDGDGSLLDHSMILYGAALSDANLHLYTDLPLLLVAGGVNGIKGGQHIRYPNRTPMTNLLVTMLDKAGVHDVDRLGDSTGKLDLTASAVRSAAL